MILRHSLKMKKKKKKNESESPAEVLAYLSPNKL